MATPSSPQPPDSHYFEHVYLTERHDRNERRTWWVVGLTALAMLAEIAAGLLTGSMALLADGFHMATHAGALTVAAIAYGFARRNAANARYTFGTGKVGDLAGFGSALLLGLAAIGIAGESVARLFEAGSVAYGEALLVAVLGLVVNIGSALILSGGHGHSHDHDFAHDHDHDHDHDHGHAHAPRQDQGGQDNNLRAAYLHVLADALTSVLAIAALLAGLYLGWTWLDPLVGLLGAIVIARWSWSLMGDTAAVLLDTAEPALMTQVRGQVESQGGIIADLHVWRIGPQAHAAIVSLSNGDAATVRTAVESIVGLEHVTVERR